MGRFNLTAASSRWAVDTPDHGSWGSTAGVGFTLVFPDRTQVTNAARCRGEAPCVIREGRFCAATEDGGGRRRCDVGESACCQAAVDAVVHVGEKLPAI